MEIPVLELINISSIGAFGSSGAYHAITQVKGKNYSWKLPGFEWITIGGAPASWFKSYEILENDGTLFQTF